MRSTVAPLSSDSNWHWRYRLRNLETGRFEEWPPSSTIDKPGVHAQPGFFQLTSAIDLEKYAGYCGASYGQDLSFPFPNLEAHEARSNLRLSQGPNDENWMSVDGMQE